MGNDSTLEAELAELIDPNYLKIGAYEHKRTVPVFPG